MAERNKLANYKSSEGTVEYRESVLLYRYWYKHIRKQAKRKIEIGGYDNIFIFAGHDELGRARYDIVRGFAYNPAAYRTERERAERDTRREQIAYAKWEHSLDTKQRNAILQRSNIAQKPDAKQSTLGIDRSTLQADGIKKPRCVRVSPKPVASTRQRSKPSSGRLFS